MVFFLRTFLVFGLFVSLWEQSIAAPPSLTLNPSDFSYNASITAVLVENCQELSNPNNLLIASVNGQVRGYVNSSTAVGSRYMAFLTVYSNKASGDTLVFQIYKADTDQLLAVKTKLVFQEDGIYGTPSAPQEIQTNNRPTDLALSSLKVPEHLTPDQILATISAQDLDKDNTLSYSLSAGANSTDNALFQITGNQLKVKGLLNTALKDTFQIRMQVADNLGCTLEKAFSLVVEKVNDKPTNLELTDSLFSENELSPTIGTFLPTDPDLNDSFTFSFVAGAGDADNSQFAIAGSLLSFTSTANFEVKNVYHIRCQVTDREGLSFDKAFVLLVRDKNDPPTNIVLSSNLIFENQPVNQFIAKLYTIDEDAVDKYEYTFANVGTNDNFSFTLVNDTLRATKVFDFETKSRYVVYLTSTDSMGVPVTKPFIITVKDTLDVPTDIGLSPIMLEENLPALTLVGVLNTVDANAPPVFYHYTFVAGTGNVDSSAFEISHDSVYSRQTFDAETKTSYQIRVRSTLANNMYVEKPFTLTIQNVNEPPTFTSLTHDSIPENTSDSTFVGYLNSIDQDKNETFVYSFVSGTRDADNKAFALKGNSLFLVKAANYEKKSFYRIQIRTSDKGGLFLDSLYTIYIVDVNESPKIVINSYEIKELSDPGTSIGIVEVKDEDKNQTFTFDILNPDVPFSINSSTGELTHQGPIDYESKTSYDLLIKVKDSGSPALADSLTLTINILDEIEGDQFPSADLVSPNGDGSNDTWNIRNVYLYSDYALQIYDQNSQLVYSVNHNYNNDWDAKLNGNTLPNGIYYYTFKSNSDGKLFKGYITVLK